MNDTDSNCGSLIVPPITWPSFLWYQQQHLRFALDVQIKQGKTGIF